jgi:alpha-amylase/alpha-mannosidase (GH57 family)
MRYVCIHGHFYQPPRENPWLGEVEEEEGAYPYHDWNERITEECYAPNTSSPVLNGDLRVRDFVNNYSRMSFDFGPTLLSWMERKAGEVYRALLEADRVSGERFSGHGSALAHPYAHSILPLDSPRDRRTQILWGMRDFRHRFGREPEGMWLPETAVNLETLELLAERGIKFTLLAPHQAARVRALGERRWREVSGGKVDPTMPYLCRLPSGRSLALFFYHGGLSFGVAFGGLLHSGEELAKRILGSFSPRPGPQLVHLATDGETYGHHHRFGDMALAYCFRHLESRGEARLTVYGEYLERHPPTHEVQILENTSWSCAHGLERWRRDCGCGLVHREGWSRRWRGPLREALDWLRDSLSSLYQREAGRWLKDPWRTREEYVEVVLDRSRLEEFLRRQGAGNLPEGERVRLLKLLEMQRHLLLMYASCGWFFDEISGLETVIILRHAARALHLAREVTGVDLEPEFVRRLGRAPSNLPEFGTGAGVYEELVGPSASDLGRIASNLVILSLFRSSFPPLFFSCRVKGEVRYGEEGEGGRVRLGRLELRSTLTGEGISFHFCAFLTPWFFPLAFLREGEGEFPPGLLEELREAFGRGVGEAVGVAEKSFPLHYTLRHLLGDPRREVLGRTVEERLGSLLFLVEETVGLLPSSRKGERGLPRSFSPLLELWMNLELERELEEGNFERVGRRMEEMGRFSLEVEEAPLSLLLSRKLGELAEKLSGGPGDLEVLERMERALSLPLKPPLWRAQVACFGLLGRYAEKRARGEEPAWVELFGRVAGLLNLRLPSPKDL